MLRDAHAHALQNRDDDFHCMVRDESCWPNLPIKREATKVLDGLSIFLTAVLVGYVWDLAYLLN
jgi:hypothetical protein